MNWRKVVLLVLLAAAIVGASLLVLVRHELTRFQWSSIFTRAGWQLPEQVIATLDIGPGDVIADIGSGDGYFTFYLAEEVGPEGTVYAVDVDGRDEKRQRTLELDDLSHRLAFGEAIEASVDVGQGQAI